MCAVFKQSQTRDAHWVYTKSRPPEKKKKIPASTNYNLNFTKHNTKSEPAVVALRPRVPTLETWQTHLTVHHSLRSLVDAQMRSLIMDSNEKK